MKVKFYYVRHGQTLFNQIGRMQGMCDSNLTDQGIEDAYDVASCLRQISFQHAFCSSSERAYKTAQMICAYQNVKPQCMKALKEFDFGDLDGEEIEKFKDAIWSDAMRDDWSEYHGETIAQFKQRTDDAFSYIVTQCNDGDNVLVVSHGSFMMHLMKTLLQFDQEAYVKRRKQQGKQWMPNCGICVFTYEDGKWAMVEEPMCADEYRLLHFPKTIQFYYVRHGETLFNIHHRLQGQCDSPLTQQGIEQVLQTKQKLKDVNFDICFTSISERARDTADILLADTKSKIVWLDDLKEINFGTLEGSEYLKDFKKQETRFYDVAYKDVGGEDLKDVQKRIVRCMNEIVDQVNNGDTVLLVSHANYYMVLLETLFDVDRKALFMKARNEGYNPTPNAGICKFKYVNGKWELERMMGEEHE